MIIYHYLWRSTKRGLYLAEVRWDISDIKVVQNNDYQYSVYHVDVLQSSNLSSPLPNYISVITVKKKQHNIFLKYKKNNLQKQEEHNLSDRPSNYNNMYVPKWHKA